MKVKHCYLLSIIIFIAGFIAFGIYLYRGYLSLNKLLVPIYAPGKTVINTDRGDIYEVYYEGILPDGGNYYTVYPFTLTVRDDSGVSMPIRQVQERKKYNYRGRTGKAVYQVNLSRASDYEFSSSINNQSFNKRLTLIFDKGFSEKRSQIIITAQAVLFFPILTSLVLFLYAYSKQ